MEERLRAIVLRAVDYKENDKILTLFSLEGGVVSAAIRGVKRANAKLKFAAQPFCFCDYILSVKGDKRSVVSAEIVDGFYPIREDIVKLYAGAVALEFVSSFVQEEPAEQIFILTLEFLKTLCYTGVSPRVALVKFLFEGLALSGYEISVDGCHKCRKTCKNRAFFNFNYGASVCEDCRDNTDIEINPLTLKMLGEVSASPFEGLKEYPPMIEGKGIKLLTYFAKIKAGVTLRSVNDLLLIGRGMQ